MAKENVEGGNSMQCVVSFFLNPNDNQVTKIAVSGDEDDFIPGELARLSGCKIIPGDSPGSFFPEGKFFFRDISSEYDFFEKGLKGVASVSVGADEEFMNFSQLLAKLETCRNEARSKKDKDDFAALISYISAEGWDWKCERGSCGNFISTDELIQSRVTICQKCIGGSN